MLATGQNIAIPNNVETEICSWASDGLKRLLGFNANGDAPMHFRLYVNGVWQYSYRTILEYNATMMDKELAVPATQLVSLRAFHTTGFSQLASGTILGG